ncbi:MAG: hypothetical protein V8T37_01030 [Streptococcus sp.]
MTVELSKEHPKGLVKFVYHYIDKNRFDLVFDKELPDGTRVFAIDQKTGKKWSWIKPYMNRRHLKAS